MGRLLFCCAGGIPRGILHAAGDNAPARPAGGDESDKLPR